MANAAIVGPKIIATAIIAAAVTIPSSGKAKTPIAHFAIAKAMTVNIMAMINAKKLIANSLNVERAFSVIFRRYNSYSFVIKFRFRLVAPNGETIATSEAYSSKDGCVNGIESVKKNAPIAKVVEAKA